jgi:DNA replication protein DnaC
MKGLNFKPRLKPSDQICDIHNEVMVITSSVPVNVPFCQTCAKERIAERNKNIEISGGEQLLKQETYDWLKRYSIGLGDRMAKQKFSTYETDENEPETIKNKQAARLIAKEYIDGGTFNTIFTGNAGAGKSHLAYAMLVAINEHSRPYKKVVYVSISKVIRMVTSSFKDNKSDITEDSMIEFLIKPDVLLIDDLGAEVGAIGTEKRASDFINKVIKGVLEERDEKPTIFTTNLNSVQLANIYDERLLSRILRGTKGHTLTFNETADKRFEQF